MISCAASGVPAAAEGVKVTLIVQLLPPPRVPMQLLFWAKSVGLEPTRLIALIMMVPAPLLVSVAFWTGLVLPVATLPNLMPVGETVAFPGVGVGRGAPSGASYCRRRVLRV